MQEKFALSLKWTETLFKKHSITVMSFAFSSLEKEVF